MTKKKQKPSKELVGELVLVVDAADLLFALFDGGTRQWVVECFLPELSKAGLKVTR